MLLCQLLATLAFLSNLIRVWQIRKIFIILKYFNISISYKHVSDWNVDLSVKTILTLGIINCYCFCSYPWYLKHAINIHHWWKLMDRFNICLHHACVSMKSRLHVMYKYLSIWFAHAHTFSISLCVSHFYFIVISPIC